MQPFGEGNSGGIGKIVPGRVGRYDDTPIAFSQYHNLPHVFREGDILGKSHRLRPIYTAKRCLDHIPIAYHDIANVYIDDLPCKPLEDRQRTMSVKWLLTGVFLWTLLVAPAARAADAVTVWTLEADRLGGGGANWHSMAIMHMAMHDTANAIRPVYARWAAPEPDEPKAAGCRLEAALAAAAARVLGELHPEARGEIDAALRHVLKEMPPGPDIAAGVRLGESIGAAAVARRRDDGFDRVHPFVGRDIPGVWRPTPPNLATSNTTETRPFLFPDAASVPAAPPPTLGGPVYLRDVDEVRRLGALIGGEATTAEYQAAVFWAFQSSQRGFVKLAVDLLQAKPRPGGLVEHARVMSILASAMADTAIIAWSEKEQFLFWRPVTAIREGGFGVVADPDWRPFLDTPPHPDYPSGHAADCFTAASILAEIFGSEVGAIDYVAQKGVPKADVRAVGMGQHAQPAASGIATRPFPSLAAAARECSLSRIWAGAHFRSADDEAERLSGIIAARALASLPPLSQ